jgi:hypothetical protein
MSVVLFPSSAVEVAPWIVEIRCNRLRFHLHLRVTPVCINFLALLSSPTLRGPKQHTPPRTPPWSMFAKAERKKWPPRCHRAGWTNREGERNGRSCRRLGVAYIASPWVNSGRALRVLSPSLVMERVSSATTVTNPGKKCPDMFVVVSASFSTRLTHGWASDGVSRARTGEPQPRGRSGAAVVGRRGEMTWVPLMVRWTARIRSSFRDGIWVVLPLFNGFGWERA